MSTPYYPSGCGGSNSLTAYNCNPCLVLEKGRVSAVAIIKNSFAFVNPSSAAEWTAGIANGNIVVIWQTQGSYDGGSTTEQPGFGRSATSNGGTDHTLIFKDPNYLENPDFYNDLRNISDRTIAFCTETAVHIVNAPVTFTPKNPVQDDVNSIVTWEVQAKWSADDSPVPYTQPNGIFESCYIS